MISTIKRLLREGSDLVSILEKGKDLSHIEKIKDKYDLVRSRKEFSIPSISDPTTLMTTTILTHKLLHVA